MSKQVIGWDIGGAHLKAAVLNGHGEIFAVIQQACPLWKGIEFLDQAVTTVAETIRVDSAQHVLTMTGELADCFSSREQGVKAIIQFMQQRLPDQQLLIFAGRMGLLKAAEIESKHYLDIASANWLASAELSARHCDAGLFVDIGSTTTDILLIDHYRLKAAGFSDYQRLVSGELLYTGVVRTAVMAIAQRAEFNGQEMGLMAEYFATMADVYRLTGDLPAAHDQAETADGGEKTQQASALRLSRLTGYEFAASDWELWLKFAGYLKAQQKQNIRLACLKQIRRFTDQREIYLIGAGVGRFLLKEIATELDMPYRDFNDLCKYSDDSTAITAADCAPAVAVAYLGCGVG